MTEQLLRESDIERKPRIITCPCGKQVEHRAGRRPRFCSARCKERARKRVRKAFVGRDTGAPTFLQKKTWEINALQGGKMLSSTGIRGPADVLAVEVFDRAWESAISSGGVEIQIGQLRQRTLVGPRWRGMTAQTKAPARTLPPGPIS